MAMTIEPCPFCGKPAEVTREDVKFENAKNGWFVQCRTEDCPAYNIAEDGEMGGVLHPWPTRKEAVAAWNRRAHLTQPAQAVGEVILPHKSRNGPVGTNVRWYVRQPPIGTKLYSSDQPAERQVAEVVTDKQVAAAIKTSPELDVLIDTELKACIAFAAYRLGRTHAAPAPAPVGMPEEVRKALEFYAGGGHIVELHIRNRKAGEPEGYAWWPAKRAELEAKGYSAFGEGTRGAEQFVEGGDTAQAALDALAAPSAQAVAYDVVDEEGRVVAGRVDRAYADEVVRERWQDKLKVLPLYRTQPARVDVGAIREVIGRMTSLVADAQDIAEWADKLTRALAGEEGSHG